MLGTPDESEWREGFQLAENSQISFPKFVASGLPKKILAGSPDLVDLISWMLKFNPADRPTAEEILSHPFIRGQSVKSSMRRTRNSQAS